MNILAAAAITLIWVTAMYPAAATAIYLLAVTAIYLTATTAIYQRTITEVTLRSLKLASRKLDLAKIRSRRPPAHRGSAARPPPVGKPSPKLDLAKSSLAKTRSRQN